MNIRLNFTAYNWSKSDYIYISKKNNRITSVVKKKYNQSYYALCIFKNVKKDNFTNSITL